VLQPLAATIHAPVAALETHNGVLDLRGAITDEAAVAGASDGGSGGTSDPCLVRNHSMPSVAQGDAIKHGKVKLRTSAPNCRCVMKLSILSSFIGRLV